MSDLPRRAVPPDLPARRLLGWGLAVLLAGAAGGCDQVIEPAGAAVALAFAPGAIPPVEPSAVAPASPPREIWPAGSHTPLWGYVDGAGTAHFADWQVDSRYSQVLPDSDAGPRVLGKKSGPQALLTWLEFAPDVKVLDPIVREAAHRTGVERELLEAVIAVESGYNPRAVSPRGALGLMQLTPETADRYGTPQERREPAAHRMLDARTNIFTGARMLADLTRRYGGIDVALAAWNAGEGAVRRAGGRMPAIAETEAHVHMVLELYWALLQRSLPEHAQRLVIAPGAFEHEGS